MTDNDDEKPLDQARRPRPVTPELRAQVAELHAQGLGRNAIARQVECSSATVTKIAREAGLDFDREATALATRARLVDLQSIRTELARKYLLIADETLELIDGPMVLGQFGGRDNVWNETLLDGPTVEQRKVLVQTAQAAHRSGLELIKQDAAEGSTVALSMLGAMREALGVAMTALEADGALPDPTVTPDQRNETQNPESETP